MKVPPSSHLLNSNQLQSAKTEAKNARFTSANQRPQFDPEKVDPKLREAAEGMEAMFVNYLFKEMRKTVPKDEHSLDSPAINIYQDMQDSEVAKKTARLGGIGLADQIVAYLSRPQYNQENRLQKTAGETNESKFEHASNGTEVRGSVASSISKED